MILNRIISILIILVSLQAFGQKEMLVPYRSGNLWGLADTNINIVVTPQFDSIHTTSNFYQGYYIVSKNGKEGVITTEKTLLPVEHNRIKFRSGFIVNYVADNWQDGAIYYNHKGEQVFQDTVYSIDRLNKFGDVYMYVIENTAHEQQLLLYNHKAGIVTQQLLNGYSVINTSEGRDDVMICFDENGARDVFELKMDDSGNVLGLNQLAKNVQPGDVLEIEGLDYQIDEYDYAEMDVDEAPNDNDFGKCAINLKLSGRRFWFIRTTTKERRYSYRSIRNSIDTAYEGEVSSKHFVVKKYQVPHKSITNTYYNESGQYHYYNQNRSTSTDYIEYTSKKKKGIVTEFGTIEAIYDSIQAFSALNGGYPYFIVGNRESKNSLMSFGVINANGEWLVALGLHIIKPNVAVRYFNETEAQTHGYIISHSDSTQSYIRWNGDTILSVCDSIFPLTGDQTKLIFKKNGHYGFDYGSRHIDPIFRDIPLDYQMFGKYKVVELYDRAFRFVGYGKLDGTMFYE
jgi:hypothetical protein